MPGPRPEGAPGLAGTVIRGGMPVGDADRRPLLYMGALLAGARRRVAAPAAGTSLECRAA